MLPASYPELYRQILAHEGGEKRPNGSKCLGLSAIACRLNMRTPSAKLRDQAVRFLKQAIGDPKFDLADFHDLRVFGEHVLLMKRAGLLTPELQRAIGTILHEHFASPTFKNTCAGRTLPATILLTCGFMAMLGF